uniref:Uncharacterized protein n=1 Tax=Anguilla anguilla TaxID=7936 RepID=A0A0E9WDV5_ANGAN
MSGTCKTSTTWKPLQKTSSSTHSPGLMTKLFDLRKQSSTTLQPANPYSSLLM